MTDPLPNVVDAERVNAALDLAAFAGGDLLAAQLFVDTALPGIDKRVRYRFLAEWIVGTRMPRFTPAWLFWPIVAATEKALRLRMWAHRRNINPKRRA